MADEHCKKPPEIGGLSVFRYCATGTEIFAAHRAPGRDPGSGRRWQKHSDRAPRSHRRSGLQTPQGLPLAPDAALATTHHKRYHASPWNAAARTLVVTRAAFCSFARLLGGILFADSAAARPLRPSCFRPLLL